MRLQRQSILTALMVLRDLLVIATESSSQPMIAGYLLRPVKITAQTQMVRMAVTAIRRYELEGLSGG